MTFWVKGKENYKNVIVTFAEDKGNYGIIRFKEARKDKATGKNVYSFFNGWRVVGTAFEGFDKLVKKVENADTFEGSDKKMGVMITIKSYSFHQEPYTKDGETKFLNTPQFVVWDWDFYSKDSGGKQGMDTPPVVEEDEADSLFGADEEDDSPFGSDEDDE